MGFQQGNGGYLVSAYQMNTSTTEQVTISGVHPNFAGYGSINSNDVLILHTGPIMVFAQIVNNQSMTARLRLQSQPGVNLASGGAGTTSTLTYLYNGAKAGERLELWATTPGFFNTTAAGATNTYLYYVPIAPTINSNTSAVMRGALF